MSAAGDALQRLVDGNRRFVEGRSSVATAAADIARTTEGQSPFAVVLGCSDSRVPVELVFDQGLGELFVIRVAGNVVAPSGVGSVEFAAERFGTRLVVVLGHSSCGAVLATLEAIADGGGAGSPNIGSIVGRIRPAIEDLPRSGLSEEGLVATAVRANVRASVAALRHGSDVIDRLASEDGLRVVGAEYSLETGTVDFFEGVPLD